MAVRVLVTGSFGFIGSHFVEHLHAEGHEVVECDQALGSEVRYADPSGCDWVAHFAARAVVDDAVAHWEAGQSFCELLERADCPVLLASSSAALNPTTLYGESKAACEELLSWHAPGGLVGRWDLCLGERYARGHVKDFTERLSKNPNVIELRGDGLRTAVYVKDLCRWLYEDMLETEGFREARYDSGRAFLISDSARWIGEHLNGETPRVVVNGETEGLRMLLGDCTKVPSLTNEEQVHKTVDWCVSQS